MKISVIIPTHNRPELLNEAIQSIITQSYSDWEIIVVDDASEPPVDISEVEKQMASKISVIRNNTSLKLAIARDQGVKAAAGELVIQLDDDDLLAPDALECALDALKQNPDFDIVFINVKGFGKRGSNFDDNQSRALQKILQHYPSGDSDNKVLQLDKHLFKYLLKSVPMAFQRSMEYKKVWNDIYEMRINTYLDDHEIADREMAIQRIAPPLRDSEWTLYAALLKRILFLNKKVYLQRCDQQGYYSIGSNKVRARNSSIDIKKHLYLGTKENKALGSWSKEIKSNYADVYFNIAYELFNESSRFKAYKMLFKAIKVTPRLKYFKFFIRMLLPV